MRTLLLTLVAMTAAAGSGRAADPPPDGPNVQFLDPFIENLVGDWDLTRSVRGQTARNRVHAEWVLNHQFLQLHMKDVATPPAYEALVLIGYSHADSEYVIHWCDVYGGKFSMTGRGRLNGDRIEFVFPDPDGSFYNTFAWNAAAKSWTSTMENSDRSGTRTPFATDVLRRVK